MYLPSPDLVNFTVIQWFDSLRNVIIGDQPGLRRQVSDDRRRALPIQKINDTHLVRTVVVDPLLPSDQGYYDCRASFTGDFVTSPVAQEIVFLIVYGKSGSAYHYIHATLIQHMLLAVEVVFQLI